MYVKSHINMISNIHILHCKCMYTWLIWLSLPCVTYSSVASQPTDTVVNKQQSQQIKQLQSLLDKARTDLAAEKNAVALSHKEAAKLRVLLKVHNVVECTRYLCRPLLYVLKS